MPDRTANFQRAVAREGQAADEDFIEDMRSPLEERLFRGNVIGPFKVSDNRLESMSGPIRWGKINPEADASILLLPAAEASGGSNLFQERESKWDRNARKSFDCDPLAKFRTKITAFDEHSITVKNPSEGSQVYVVGDYTNFSKMLQGERLNDSGEIIGANGSSPSLAQPNQTDPIARAKDAARSDNDFIAIKGPPGTGKTHLLAEIALELAQAGNRVTITGPSHAAVNNALQAIVDAQGGGSSLEIAKSSGSMAGLDRKEVTNLKELGLKGEEKREKLDAADLILGATISSLSGTLNSGYYDDWEREILIVDEAGQLLMMQLAAISGFYQRVLFFGDESQLAPVTKAQHAPHSGEGDSCMQYLIRKRGMDWVFPLEATHRLNTRICEVVQQNFYPEIKLHPVTHANSRIDTGASQLGIPGNGVDFIDVPHQHACTRSEIEIEAVKSLVKDLIDHAQITLATEQGSRPVTAADFAVLAPFRNQVSGLQQILRPLGLTDAQIGTVDKMQGQGRPIVIYSCTTSSADVLAEQAEFIYSPNRWNVLISRAMAQCYIVGNREALTTISAQTLTGLAQASQIIWLIESLPHQALAASTGTPAATAVVATTPPTSAPTPLKTQGANTDPKITIDPAALNLTWNATGHTATIVTLRKSQWQRICKWLASGKSKLRIVDAKKQPIVEGFPDSRALRFNKDFYWRPESAEALKIEISEFM